MNAHAQLWNLAVTSNYPDKWLKPWITTDAEFKEISIDSGNTGCLLHTLTTEEAKMYFLFFALYFGGDLEV